jgi:hypothetical protein
VKAAAYLCDAATVREGLAHILGGGVNLLRRRDFPAPMAVKLVIMLEQDLTEARDSHKVNVVIRSDQGPDVLGRIEGALEPQGEPKDPDLDLPLTIPVILPLDTVVLPRPGRYAIDIHIEGADPISLKFGMTSS